MIDDNRCDESSPLRRDRGSASHGRLVLRCVAVGVVTAAVAFILFGWSVWTAIIVALLLGCPAVVALALISQCPSKIAISQRGR